MTNQKAIMREEAIEQLCEWHAIMTGEGAPTHSLHLKNVKVIEMCIEALEQTRWIPVSERLPEKTDYYLIQYSREVCPDEMAVAFYSVEEAEVDSNYTWEFKPIADCKEVIAWMPLPVPYQPPKIQCEED